MQINDSDMSQAWKAMCLQCDSSPTAPSERPTLPGGEANGPSRRSMHVRTSLKSVPKHSRKEFLRSRAASSGGSIRRGSGKRKCNEYRLHAFCHGCHRRICQTCRGRLRPLRRGFEEAKIGATSLGPSSRNHTICREYNTES